MDICKHNEFCGGCMYQEKSYEEQLKIKEKEVLDLLEKHKIDVGEYLGMEGAPSQYRYRNKMEYTFGDMEKDGPLCLGMHKKHKFMSIVTVDECQIVHEDFNTILRATLDFCTERGYKFYHKKTHLGLVRNLVLRRGEHTNEILINMVTSSQEEFDEEGYVQMIQNLNLENEVVGILRTINDRIADAVYCDELKILWGRDYYMEKIMGLIFQVSEFSFFQTNVSAVERLYTEAISMIDDYDNKRMFDLYCGTGTITQSLATKARDVVGVELVEDAVDAARENAKLNGLQNCRFIAGDVFEVLDQIEDTPDVIVVDPPRVGIQPKALDKILSYGVDQILYISCNPKTLAGNLQYMQGNGYRVEKLKAYDNFPMTKHVETVVLLSREKVDGYIEIDYNVDK